MVLPERLLGNLCRLLVTIVAGMLVSGGVRPALAQGQPVRIGVLGGMSGIASSIGGPGSVAAARLAVSDAGGRVLGRPVEIVSADHQDSPDIARTIALRWFDQEDVVAIADLNLTAAALAVVEAGRLRHRATMVSGAASADFAGRWCSPYNTLWSDDTWTLSRGLVRALLAQGLDTWFFVVADVAFGNSLAAEASDAVRADGGRVLGTVRHPLGTADFSSFLLAAQGSGAKVVALGSVGTDTVNALKQAAEFGLTRTQRIATFLTFITDIDAVGQQQAQGALLLSGFYWDQSDPARAFARRFGEAMGGTDLRVPTKEQAAVYASVRHFLRAVEAAGTTDATAVGEAMRRLPVDFLGRPGSIRRDGRVLFDVSLYRVKVPEASKARWDLYEEVSRLPAAEAYRPEDSAPCKG